MQRRTARHSSAYLVRVPELLVLGEEPVGEAGFFEDRFPDFVAEAFVFGVAGHSAGLLQCRNHVAGMLGSDDIVLLAMECPDRGLRSARSQPRIAGAAHRNRGSKQARPFGNESKGPDAAIGLAGNIKPVGSD